MEKHPPIVIIYSDCIIDSSVISTDLEMHAHGHIHLCSNKQHNLVSGRSPWCRMLHSCVMLLAESGACAQIK